VAPLYLWVNITAAMAKSFRALFEQAYKSDEYWLDGPILEFGEELSRLMQEQKISKAELARRLGTSPAYVTKVLRGNANFTLASMAKLARVFDHEVRVHLAPRDTITRWKDTPRSVGAVERSRRDKARAKSKRGSASRTDASDERSD
jgi:transcriptional regulator with XRE-family HTH domain